MCGLWSAAWLEARRQGTRACKSQSLACACNSVSALLIAGNSLAFESLMHSFADGDSGRTWSSLDSLDPFALSWAV